MKKQKERPGVMLYFHLLNPLKNLSREAFGELVWALIQYAQGGEAPVFEDPMQEMSWAFLQHASDLDQERYEERCRLAKAAAEKRWQKDAEGCDRMPSDANHAKYNTNTDTDTTTETKTDPAAAAPTTAAAAANTTATPPPASPLARTNGSGLPDIVACYLPPRKTTEEEAARLKAEALAKLRALPPDA